MLKHPLVLLLGAILITSIIVFPTTNAQLPQQQLVESDGGGLTGTLFQNIDDGFRVQVPEGWVIHRVDNNAGSTLLEEARQGYGRVTQLCAREEQLQAALPNIDRHSIYGNCEGLQGNTIYIIQYLNLDTRLQSAFDVSSSSTTTDKVLPYYIQKLQEVGYSNVQIVNSTDTTERTVNVINATTNQTIATVPTKLVEMTYTTASATPNEIRRGYFILIAADATPPIPEMSREYGIFYAASPVAALETTTSSSGSLPLPAVVMQVFDSFEIIAPERLTFGDNDNSISSSSSSSSSDSSSSRCPDGYHRSPSGDCERVTDTRGLPRCPDGYHRSPDGDCEYVG